MAPGWFELARPEEIGAGHVVTRHAFGTEVAPLLPGHDG